MRTHAHAGTRPSVTCWVNCLATVVFLLLSACANDTGNSGNSNATVPGAPTDLAASPGDEQVTISWDPGAGADSYNLYWNTATGVTAGAGTQIPNSTSPYTHTALTNGTTYYYVVTAVNADGESAESAEVNATPQVPAPGAPTGVAASPGDEQVTISWDPVTGADSYNLYWATSSGVTKTSGTQISDVTSPYVRNGLTNGTTYYYVVTAANAGGESAESAEVGATPRVVLSIALGSRHTLALKVNGTLWAWGRNDYGELGLGDMTSRTEPTQVGTEEDWAALAAGGDDTSGHTLAIKRGGTLWVWGANGVGQLGLGDTVNRNSPTRLGTTSNWVAVAAGFRHSLALTADGFLWGWGSNSSGQLGLGDSTDRYTPTQVGTASDWVTVAAGGTLTLALKSNGTLWAWGWNHLGQLGLGDNNGRTSPTQVGTDADWVAAEGGGHTLGVKVNRSLWSTGDNVYGQLGLGDTNNRSTMTQVGTDSDYFAVATGGWHSLALKSNKTLWAWGRSETGQLGLGDRTGHSLSTQVGTDANWIAVAAGTRHSLALKNDGSVWAWGWNLEGQLGLGDSINRSEPTQVPLP